MIAGGERQTTTVEAVNRRGRSISCVVSVLPLTDGDGDGPAPRGAIVLMEDQPPRPGRFGGRGWPPRGGRPAGVTEPDPRRHLEQAEEALRRAERARERAEKAAERERTAPRGGAVGAERRRADRA